MDVSFIMPFDNICLVPYSLDNLSEKNRLPPTLGKPNSRDPIQSTKLHDNLSVWGCNPVRSPPKSSSSRKGKSGHSGLIIQCHTGTPYKQDPNLGEDKGGLLGPKKYKYKVCSLLNKAPPNSSAANSSKLLDIKTEVRAQCATILIQTLWEML